MKRKYTTDRNGMLAPYRILDLTDEKGWMCGKLLGDLGADVIKIEPPGGDPARNTGPFYHDEIDPEKSLYWFAYNTSKRGITLDLETTDGKGIFIRLAEESDFVLESFHPGYLEELGLGYDILEEINPRLILVSITPFGPAGPYRDYKAPDIVAWAMGGHMYHQGDPDRPPVRVSYHPQAYNNAGAEAAAAALVALRHRRLTGDGQQVDVPIQEVVARTILTANWDQNRIYPTRSREIQLPSGETIRPIFVWPCKDGEVIWFYAFGSPIAKARIDPLIHWIDEEGMATDFLRSFNWETFQGLDLTQEILDRIATPTTEFFLSHTKAELYEGAIARQIFLYPVSNVAEVCSSPQLAFRSYWRKIHHPDLDETITYPGPFFSSTEASPDISHPAPGIGEHNIEIYHNELGISRKQLVSFRENGVI